MGSDRNMCADAWKQFDKLSLKSAGRHTRWVLNLMLSKITNKRLDKSQALVGPQKLKHVPLWRLTS